MFQQKPALNRKKSTKSPTQKTLKKIIFDEKSSNIPHRVAMQFGMDQNLHVGSKCSYGYEPRINMLLKSLHGKKNP
jgi:hypothetical protein